MKGMAFGIYLISLYASFAFGRDAPTSVIESNDDPAVLVSKCCDVASVLVESDVGVRSCVRRTDLEAGQDITRGWSPTFYELETETETSRPRTYQLKNGLPSCDFKVGRCLSV